MCTNLRHANNYAKKILWRAMFLGNYWIKFSLLNGLRFKDYIKTVTWPSAAPASIFYRNQTLDKESSAAGLINLYTILSLLFSCANLTNKYKTLTPI